MVMFVAYTGPIISTNTLLGSVLSLAMAGLPSFSAIFPQEKKIKKENVYSLYI